MRRKRIEAPDNAREKIWVFDTDNQISRWFNRKITTYD
ncbi:hypothetical Protein YC6258_00392 [Gynuella sunshinyii YC6258]|uniref:Uncharacterized protein n=1 Tax=Gynuella sunshinyii YC6258 TaxID=1445510 RepID=A0A0C5VD33_9GAMM|nr:hypothetical Protein YC6258_00392 [Gynuella sunshinyii YC6258]